MGRKGYGNDWTAGTIRRPLERMYRAGMPYKEIARQLGIDVSGVRRWMVKLDVPRRPWQVTTEERRRMVTLREDEQMTIREIARQTGRAESTIRNHLQLAEREMGREIRVPHERIHELRLDGLRRLHWKEATWQPVRRRRELQHGR